MDLSLTYLAAQKHRNLTSSAYNSIQRFFEFMNPSLKEYTNLEDSTA